MVITKSRSDRGDETTDNRKTLIRTSSVQSLNSKNRSCLCDSRSFGSYELLIQSLSVGHKSQSDTTIDTFVNGKGMTPVFSVGVWLYTVRLLQQVL